MSREKFYDLLEIIKPGIEKKNTAFKLVIPRREDLQHVSGQNNNVLYNFLFITQYYKNNKKLHWYLFYISDFMEFPFLIIVFINFLIANK